MMLEDELITRGDLTERRATLDGKRHGFRSFVDSVLSVVFRNKGCGEKGFLANRMEEGY